MKHRTTVFGICSGRVNKSVVFFSEFLLEHSSKHMAEMLRASRLVMTETIKPRERRAGTWTGKEGSQKVPSGHAGFSQACPLSGSHRRRWAGTVAEGDPAGGAGRPAPDYKQKEFLLRELGGTRKPVCKKDCLLRGSPVTEKHHMCTYTSKVPRD